MNEKLRRQSHKPEHKAARFSTTWEPEDKRITGQRAVFTGKIEGLVEEATFVLDFEE